jgi:hypothetical protein
MRANSPEAKSLINDMLQKHAENLEMEMRRVIQRQLDFYKLTKERTVSKMLGNLQTEFTLTQQFKYQESIGATLREMERTFLEYFGKPWDYVEPEVAVETKECDKPKGKRSRPRKD